MVAETIKSWSWLCLPWGRQGGAWRMFTVAYWRLPTLYESQLVPLPRLHRAEWRPEWGMAPLVLSAVRWPK